MGALDLVKKHPVATGVIVVVVVGGVLLLTGGSDATAVDSSGGSSGDELAASLAMQQLQAGLQAQALEVGAAKEIALNESATALTMAQLSKEVALQQGAWTYQLEEARLASEERVTTSTNTLTAALRQQELANDLAEETMENATLNNQINMQYKMYKESRKPKGLFSAIFG